MKKIYTLLATLLFFVCTVFAAHVPVSNSNGYTLGNKNLGGFNWDDKTETLSFTGIPSTLSFSYKYSSGSSTQKDNLSHMYIEESADNSNWSKIWENGEPTTTATAVSNIPLQKSTRYIKFHFRGNFAGYYSNIKVSELVYVEDPQPASLDLGTAAINAGEVSATTYINWCSVQPLSVTCDNDRFTVTPASFGALDQFGSQTIKVSYTHTNEASAQNGTITISNASFTKTVTVSATTVKRPQTIRWNDAIVSTGYAMNISETYPNEEVTVIAATESGGEIVYSSSDPTVISVSEDGKVLTAVAAGTADITAYQAGDKEYEEVSDIKTFTVTNLLKQSITWEQNLLSLLTTSEPVGLTATASSGGTIVYTSANESVARIDGSNLLVVGEGETTITATQEGGLIGDKEYLSIAQEKTVIVRNPASQCNGRALNVSSLTLSSSALSKEYTLSGFPETLTFSALHGTKSGSFIGFDPVYSSLIVEQFAYINDLWDWYKVYDKVVGTSATASGNIALDETATKLRFRTTETGTTHTISTINVTRKKFMRADVAQIATDAEANTIWQQTITVSHSNIDMMIVTTKRGLLTPNITLLGEGCGDFGDDAFVVSFTPTERDMTYLDTIVITDGKVTPSVIEIPVSLHAIGLNQAILGFVLPTNCKTTDTILMPEVTTTSGLTEIQFLSSDSTVAYVENNQLVILQAGTVTITAYQAGDDKYNPASATQTIVIALTPVTILEAPRANDMATGEPLSTAQLIGGKAEVEGSFAWVTPDVIPAEGTQTYEVLFTPERDTYYATATTSVQVNVMPNPATFGEYADSFCEGDSVEFKGVWYAQTTRDSVLLTDTLNRFGGDSIVIITMTMLKHTAYEESLTIVYGTDTAWNGIALNDSTVGEHIVTYVTTNAAGCDSTVTLYLTVEKQQTIEQPVALSFCQGGFEEFRDKTYTEAGNDTILALGDFRDTLYIVNVTVLLPSDSTEYKTIVYGAEESWNGIALKDSTVGEHIVTYVTTNASGCDSTVTLYLTVEKQQTVEVPVALSFCAGGSEEFRGKTYIEPALDTIPAAGDIRDTLYIVNVTVLLPSDSTEYKTIVYGAEESWNGIALNDSTVGEHIVTYVTTNAAGCDSTVTLYLTVEKQAAYEAEQELNFCEGDSVEFRDKWYTEAGVDTLYAKGEVRDTILYVTVFVRPLYAEEWSGDTITVGDTLTLPSGLWLLGDSIVLTYVALEEDTLGLTFVQHCVTDFGCDSTITLHVAVLPKEAETPETPTAIEQVRRNEEALKQFRNGVIYIRREGKEFTIDGRLVK